MDLDIRHEPVSGIDVVHVAGDLDIHSAPVLRERLRELIGEEPHDVVVDLAQVSLLDSLGLGVLIGALKRARAHGGTVRLAAPSPLAVKTLRITGLVKVFSTHPDVAAALAEPHPLPPAGA